MIGAATLACFALQVADARTLLIPSLAQIDVSATTSIATVSGDEIFPNSFEAPFNLTISNDVAWCSVTIDGGAPDSSGTIMASIFPGITAQLHAEPLPGFDWGFWNGTDDGNGYTQMDTTVTMTSDRSVEVCCPIPPPGHPDCSF
jgi:hypothetical protein